MLSNLPKATQPTSLTSRIQAIGSRIWVPYAPVCYSPVGAVFCVAAGWELDGYHGNRRGRERRGPFPGLCSYSLRQEEDYASGRVDEHQRLVHGCSQYHYSQWPQSANDSDARYGWMNRQNVVHPYTEILFGNKKEQGTCHNVGEPPDHHGK